MNRRLNNSLTLSSHTLQFSASGFIDDGMTDSIAPSSVLEDGINPQFWQRGLKCFICERKFSALVIRRHHCRFCGQSVCDLHSMARKEHPEAGGLARICDFCNKVMIGHSVKEDYQAKFYQRTEQLKTLRRQLEIREQEEAGLLIKRQELERKKAEIDEQFAAKEKETEERLENETRVCETYTRVAQSLKAALEQANSAERMGSSGFSEKSAECSSLQGEAEFLARNITECNNRVDSLHSQAQDRISKAKIPDLLCLECQRKNAMRSFISDRETTYQLSERMTSSSHTQVPNMPSTRACQGSCSLF